MISIHLIQRNHQIGHAAVHVGEHCTCKCLTVDEMDFLFRKEIQPILILCIKRHHCADFGVFTQSTVSKKHLRPS